MRKFWLMRMLACLLVLASLCNLANGGAVEIDVCHMFVPVPPQGARVPAQPAVVRKPTVPVENCQDRDVLACPEIFKYDPAADMQVLANNLMP